jgi:hypothetical protein
MKKIGLLISLILLTFNCAKTDPITGEKVIIEPDPVKKARDSAARSGGLFGEIGGAKSSNQTVNFQNANVLWRATLKTLDFLPLISSDYSGGILIYDWYSQTNNPKEQIKISVQFLNNELRADSIKITAHKKICDSADRCSNSTLDQNFANSIKENIIASARSLKIEESKKEKK